MKKKSISILLLSALVLTGVTACKGQAQPTQSKKAETVQSSSASAKASKNTKSSSSSASSSSAKTEEKTEVSSTDQSSVSAGGVTAEVTSEVAAQPASESSVSAEVATSAASAEQVAPANSAAVTDAPASQASSSTPPAQETTQGVPAIGEEAGPATGLVMNSTVSREGTYTIKARTAVKNAPALAAASIDYYEAGQTVNYDQILEADGHRWLSYMSTSGVRRYFSTGPGQASVPDEGGASTSAPAPVASQTLYGRAIGQLRVLNVPQYYQTTMVHCAPTTVSMMLASRGISADPIALGTQMGTAAPFGTHNRDAIRILNRHLFGYDYPANGQAGYRLETVYDVASALPLFKQRVIQNIADGYPMYYTIDVSKVYPGHTGEHNIAGTGYILTPDGSDIAFLTYNDPSFQGLGQTYQGMKVITPEALLAAMTGPAATEPMYAW